MKHVLFISAALLSTTMAHSQNERFNIFRATPSQLESLGLSDRRILEVYGGIQARKPTTLEELAATPGTRKSTITHLRTVCDVMGDCKPKFGLPPNPRKWEMLAKSAGAEGVVGLARQKETGTTNENVKHNKEVMDVSSSNSGDKTKKGGK